MAQFREPRQKSAQYLQPGSVKSSAVDTPAGRGPGRYSLRTTSSSIRSIMSSEVAMCRAEISQKVKPRTAVPIRLSLVSLLACGTLTDGCASGPIRGEMATVEDLTRQYMSVAFKCEGIDEIQRLTRWTLSIRWKLLIAMRSY